MRIPREDTLRWAAAVLALLGVGVATYIAIADSSGGAPVCLAGGGGCETVAASSYSHLAGVNVAVFGIVGYVLLIAAALTPGDRGRFAGLAVSLAGFGFSAYLTYLELFVIEAICQWCVSSAVLMTAVFAVNATRAFAYLGRPARLPASANSQELEEEEQ
ncbi:MAG TPA: vitamin K epoxide reductase family protein [Solirubrobacterales bacterium]